MQYKIKWNSLSDFKNFLERETKEEVVSFNGYELVTKKGIYSLAFGKLSFTEIKKKKR
jgi:hypothetical protein